MSRRFVFQETDICPMFNDLQTTLSTYRMSYDKHFNPLCKHLGEHKNFHGFPPDLGRQSQSKHRWKDLQLGGGHSHNVQISSIGNQKVTQNHHSICGWQSLELFW